MFQYLKIADLALIERAEVEFGPGFNVITGESGAGKSVLLSALTLLLGGRADKGVIRTGARRCELAGILTVPPALRSAVEQILAAAGIAPEPGSEVQLRRTITESSTRFFLNDTPVTAQLIRKLAALLVDVQTVHEQGALIHRSEQLRLLDRYAGAEALREACAELCRRRRELAEAREAFVAGRPSAVEAEHLELVVQEIERINPVPGEDEELTARHRLAAHAREVLEVSARAVAWLNDSEESIRDRLAAVYRELQKLSGLDEAGTGELLTACDLLLEGVDELATGVSALGEKVELDEAAFAELESRLSALHTLKRRYGPSLEQVLATADEARRHLEDYRTADARLTEFAARDAELLAELKAKAAELSQRRRQGVGTFLAEARRVLTQLGFGRAELSAEFTPVEPGPAGQEQLELLFSANPGETPRPLRRIASSGELSRLMLALKTVLADADAVPVVIFDEIDRNIGGETANEVGRMLRELGGRHQVLCISHLAQVAARGHEHFRVVKQLESGRMVSRIGALTGAERVGELARMLGGGAAALEHARVLAQEEAES